jgi:hypothetical protein
MDTAEELTLEVWRLHPRGARLVPADKRLLGEAPPAALKWCGPFTNASQAGWWLYPPLDIDIVYRPAGEGGTYDEKFDANPDCFALKRLAGYFEHRLVGEDEHAESEVIRGMLRARHRFRRERRQPYALGDVEMNVASVWTGCIFKTPPGWCLLLRSPINLAYDEPFRVQEAILETDWMPYDVWLNLKFFEHDRWTSLRRYQHYPLAQLVPVPRASFAGKWGVNDSVLSRAGEQGERAAGVFDEWNEYNFRKWGGDGRQKDSATYRKERRRSGV